MLKYILKRLGMFVLTLFIVVSLTFFMMQLMPGTPFSNPKLSPDQLAVLSHTYGLDKPLWEQYFLYLSHIATGNFGESFIYKNQPVLTMIAQRLPVSMQFGLQAVILGTIIGIILGILAALRKNTWVDSVISFIAILGASIPSFVVGSLLLLLFGFSLQVLPIAGWDGFSSSIMPTLALSFGAISSVTKYVRSEMIESMNSDYILLARSKGLSEGEVVRKHALRNSLMPLLTLLGPMFAGAITGSVLLERIFNIPGIGSQFVDSIPAKDFPVIMATTIVYAAALMIFILITDILMAIVDPRVRLA
ncbi:ABC transporter permease [Lactovum odontotermitis]